MLEAKENEDYQLLERHQAAFQTREAAQFSRFIYNPNSPFSRVLQQNVVDNKFLKPKMVNELKELMDQAFVSYNSEQCKALLTQNAQMVQKSNFAVYSDIEKKLVHDFQISQMNNKRFMKLYNENTHVLTAIFSTEMKLLDKLLENQSSALKSFHSLHSELYN